METNQPDPNSAVASRHNNDWRAWLPSRGNVLLVLVVAGALLLYVHNAGAVPGAAPAAASTSIVPYQGRLADAGGNPLNGSFAMTFRLYNVATSGVALWTETWTGGSSIRVIAGLFDVLLGSLTPIPSGVYAANDSLWLGITVGADTEMTPRVQLGSVPFAGKAQVMPIQSVTTTMLADGAVSLNKLAAYPLIYTSPEVGGSTSQTQTVPIATITITVGYKASILLVSVADASMTSSGWIYLALTRNGTQIQGLSPDVPTANIRQTLSMTAAETVGPGSYVYDARIAPVGASTANWEHARLTAIVIPSP